MGLCGCHAEKAEFNLRYIVLNTLHPLRRVRDVNQVQFVDTNTDIRRGLIRQHEWLDYCCLDALSDDHSEPTTCILYRKCDPKITDYKKTALLNM